MRRALATSAAAPWHPTDAAHSACNTHPRITHRFVRHCEPAAAPAASSRRTRPLAKAALRCAREAPCTPSIVRSRRPDTYACGRWARGCQPRAGIPATAPRSAQAAAVGWIRQLRRFARHAAGIRGPLLPETPRRRHGHPILLSTSPSPRTSSSRPLSAGSMTARIAAAAALLLLAALLPGPAAARHLFGEGAPLLLRSCVPYALRFVPTTNLPCPLTSSDPQHGPASCSRRLQCSVRCSVSLCCH